MSLAKRLTRIETSLTPKQAVLLWLKEAQQLDHDVFLEKCFKCPMHEAPGVRIPEMAERAVRDSLSKKGMKPELIARAELEAWKQANFLFVLVLQLNEKVGLDGLQSTPQLRFLLAWLGWLEEQHNEHEVLPAPTWARWRTLFIETLGDMLLLRAVIETVSEEIYDSHSVLFPDVETSLARRIQCAEILAKDYNGYEGALPSWTAIDLAALRSSIEAQVPAAVAELVAHAKAKTLQALGEWRAAWDLLEPYALATIEKRCSCNVPE